MDLDYIKTRYECGRKIISETTAVVKDYCQSEGVPLRERFDLFASLPREAREKSEWMIHFSCISDDYIYGHCGRGSTVDVVSILQRNLKNPELYPRFTNEGCSIEDAMEELITLWVHEVNYDW